MPVKQLSIIIPAYNCEDTLAQALNSITNQEEALPLLDIVVVENGSSDRTVDIAQSYVEEYPNTVRLIKSEKGVSIARNRGLDVSVGQWILFLDADDFLLANALKTVLEDISKQTASLYIYGYEKYGITQIKMSENSRLLIRDDYHRYAQEQIANPTRAMQVWAKVFHKDTIDNALLRFDTHMPVAEDSDFLMQYMLLIDNVYISNKLIYHYSSHATSTVRTYDENKATYYQEAVTTTIGRRHMEWFGNKALSQYVLIHLNIMMVRVIFSLENSDSFFQKCRTLRQFANRPIFVQAMKNLTAKECLTPRLLPMLFLKCRLDILAGAMYFIRVMQNHKQGG